MHIPSKMRIFTVIISLCLVISSSYAKGGRGGFSSRGGGFSRGGGSKTGGFSFSINRSKPSPSQNFNSAPSRNSPPSYGWNVKSGSGGSNTQSNPSYGWNVGNNNNAGSKTGNTNYGWNTNNNNAPKPSAPVGPPPAYPGLQNRPVPNNNLPPAYSPSHNNPPPYSQGSYNSKQGNNFASGNSYPRQNTYNTYGSNPGYYQNSYGNTFGSQGLPANTYISNNYYGSRGSSFGSTFLTNAFFYGAGMYAGNLFGRHNSYDSYNRRKWDEEDDKRWRATTQAPYFENKVPGEDKILPASAVMGAATAFGLVSLLPLNVPSYNPIMYCTNDTALMQAQIQVNNETLYQCINGTIGVSCLQANQGCVNRTMHCDFESSDNYFCSNGTLLSRNSIFCNSTTLLNGTNVNEMSAILNCYEGQLPENQVAFIPTTTTTPAPVTEKSLSFAAKAHLFFMKLIGKGDVIEKTTTTTPAPQLANAWIPEALTIPPEPATTEAPFVWMEKTIINFENGTSKTELKPVSQVYIDLYKSAIEKAGNSSDAEAMTYPPHWTKVFETTTSSPALR